MTLNKNIGKHSQMIAALILAGSYSLCHSTELIWQDVCDKYDIELKVYSMTEGNLPKYIEEKKLKSFPSLVIDNNVVAVGHPADAKSAEKVISKLIKSD